MPDYAPCECLSWISEGYACGKPGCPETVYAEAYLENMWRGLLPYSPSSEREGERFHLQNLRYTLEREIAQRAFTRDVKEFKK